MKNLLRAIMAFAAICIFLSLPQASSAEFVKPWGENALDISRSGGTGGTYGYGRKASDGSLFAYYWLADDYNYGAERGIYVQKISKGGQPLWGERGKLVYKGGSYDASIVDLAPDENGGAVAVWGTGWPDYELRAKRFDSNGNEDPAWETDGVLIVSNVGGHIFLNTAIPDGSGGAIVIWTESQISTIYVQRVGSDGQLKWNNGTPLSIGTGFLYSGWEEGHNAVPDGRGGAFIAWSFCDGMYSVLCAQHIDSDGVTQWADNGITAIPYPQGEAVGNLVLDGSGGVIITTGAWGNEFVLQRLDAEGNLLWRNSGIYLGRTGGLSFLEPVGNSEFVLVWDKCCDGLIHAQKIDVNGNFKWGDGVSIGSEGTNYFFPHVLFDGDGGTWVSFLYNTERYYVGQGIAVQHLDKDGNPFACNPIHQDNPNIIDMWEHSIVSDDAGGVYVSWDGVQNLGEVYAQRITKTGQREVCGSKTVKVAIDIKPGSYPNSINLGSKGVIPVAVLSSGDFDATMIDGSTVTFAGVQVFHSGSEDVNKDGLLDMVFHFQTQELKLDSGSTAAVLTGKTFDGFNITGEDTVNIVPKK